MNYEKDIKKWTLDYAIEIVKLIRDLKLFGVEYSLRDQLLRSGTSIGANVRESIASSSRKELIRYYKIALRSADETGFWVDVIQKGYNMGIEPFARVSKERDEIAKVLAAIIKKLKNNT